MTLLLLFNNQVAPDAAQTMPTVQVLLETTADVMVDVSADYEMFTTVRGRNRELDEFQAGTAQVTLLDTSRKYDPSNTAGPYYPNLKPMRSLQLTGTWNGTTYPVFTGYVDSIESEYAGPPSGNATTTIYATDGFKVLEAADLASSGYAQEVTNNRPVSWWRLGDATGSTVLRDAVGSNNLTINGTPTLGAAGLVSREADDAISMDQTTDGAARFGTPTVTGPPMTFEMVFRTDLAGGGTSLYGETNGIVPLRGWAVECSGTTCSLTVITDTASGAVATTGSVADALVHHLAFTWAADGTLNAYFDGALQATTVVAAGTFPTAMYSILGGGPSGVSGGTAKFGTYDELAVYNTVLTDAQVLAHAQAVATPWNGDTPGARLARVLDAAGWPAALRQLDTGTSTLQSAELAQTALEHAQKTAASDFGALFVRADGAVRFIGRAGLFNKTEAATFGDGGGAELGYVSLRPETTDQLIRNDVTISRLEGAAQNAKDTTSIRDYLRHSYVADGLLHNSDTLSRNAAEFIVSEFKDPQRRISNLTLAPRGDPSNLFPQVLARDLEDQITVKDRPPGGGAANSQDTTIEGISHTVTPMWWDTAWNLAPSFGASGTPGNVWALGIAGLSELGDTTRLSF